jgi:hypothetical protein
VLAALVQVTILIQAVLLMYVVAAAVDNKLHLDDSLRVVGTQEVQLRTLVLKVYFAHVLCALIL